MHWLEKWFIPPKCVVTGLPTLDRDLVKEVVKHWKTPKAVCPQCCELSASGEICGACLSHPPAFDRTQVGFYYGQELVGLIHELKYQDQLSNARILAEVLAERWLEWNDYHAVEALVAVPLHTKRFRDRGYNQAELIADTLAKRLNIPFIRQAVGRVKETPSQTHLNAQQRRNNLKQAFKVEPSRLDGLSHIAIVDDVITTGATMQALALEIKAQTAIQVVEAWAVAKTR